jgi:hypothetical protein
MKAENYSGRNTGIKLPSSTKLNWAVLRRWAYLYVVACFKTSSPKKYADNLEIWNNLHLFL